MKKKIKISNRSKMLVFEARLQENVIWGMNLAHTKLQKGLMAIDIFFLLYGEMDEIKIEFSEN